MTLPTRAEFSTSLSSSQGLDRAEARSARQRIAAVAGRLPLGSPKGVADMFSSDEATPLIGKPPPMPLPIVMMSGFRPNCSEAHIVPVRPKPARISSAISSAPNSVGDLAHRVDEVVRRNDVARRALHRLDDDRGDLALGVVLDDVAQMLGAGQPAGRMFQVPRAAIAIGVGRMCMPGGNGP